MKKVNPIFLAFLFLGSTCEPAEPVYGNPCMESLHFPAIEINLPDPASNPVSLGDYIITGYCACDVCCGKNDGITASGTKATQGRTIAADTNVLPFGTEVLIDGVVYTVEDRGGAIQGNRIDIYFDSHAEALEYGVRSTEVYYGKVSK